MLSATLDINMLRHRGYDSLIAFLDDPRELSLRRLRLKSARRHREIVRTTDGVEIV